MDTVKEINKLIKEGLIDTSMNTGTCCLVWGARVATYNNMTWTETKGRFLGGGVYESWGYTLTHNGRSILIKDYVTSLRMFLNYIRKTESAKRIIL
jgi:hypothetical protein